MTTDLRTMIAAADPVRGDEYDEAALRRRAREVLAVAGGPGAMAGGPGDVGPRGPGAVARGPGDIGPRGTTTAPDFVVIPRNRPPRRAPRRIAAVVAVAAALVAGVVALPSLPGGATAEHRAAAALLDRAADLITATDEPTRPDQYWQITSSGFVLSIRPEAAGFSNTLVGQTRTTYVAVDGTRPTYVVTTTPQLLRQISGTPPTQKDLVDANPPGTVETAPTSDADATWGTPTPAFLRGLPRDPTALLQRIRSDTAGQGRSADGEVVVTVRDVLGSGIVPADLRQALYRVLAAVPGIVVTARDVDLGGGTGIAFGYDEVRDGLRQEIVVDPADGELLGVRQVAVEAVDGMPAGTVYVQQAIARRVLDAVPPDVVAAAG